MGFEQLPARLALCCYSTRAKVFAAGSHQNPPPFRNILRPTQKLYKYATCITIIYILKFKLYIF